MHTIIIPCFNRKAITLGCLSRLRESGVSARFRVLVVDDASTDGTAEVIVRDYPEVEVLYGRGELYWTGAMELGMRHAVATGATCCIWLNDDLVVGNSSIERIVELALQKNAIVTGQGIIRQTDSELWYFWILLKKKYGVQFMPPERFKTCPIAVDTCRGNMVAIPRAVTDKIGYPDGINIPHLAGDTDFGLRATAANIPCLLLPNAIFYELETVRVDNNSWLLSDKSVIEIAKLALTKRGVLYPRMVVVYSLRHWKLRGVVMIVRDFSRIVFILLLKLVVPRQIRHRIFAGAWRLQRNGAHAADR